MQSTPKNPKAACHTITERLEMLLRLRHISSVGELCDDSGYMTEQIVTTAINHAAKGDLGRSVKVFITLANRMDANPGWLVFGVGSPLHEISAIAIDTQDAFQVSVQQAIVLSARFELGSRGFELLFNEFCRMRDSAVIYPNRAAANVAFPTDQEGVQAIWNRLVSRRDRK